MNHLNFETNRFRFHHYLSISHILSYSIIIAWNFVWLSHPNDARFRNVNTFPYESIFWRRILDKHLPQTKNSPESNRKIGTKHYCHFIVIRIEQQCYDRTSRIWFYFFGKMFDSVSDELVVTIWPLQNNNKG